MKTPRTLVREEDLSTLIPGEQVKVSLDGANPEWFMYFRQTEGRYTL